MPFCSSSRALGGTFISATETVGADPAGFFVFLGRIRSVHIDCFGVRTFPCVNIDTIGRGSFHPDAGDSSL